MKDMMKFTGKGDNARWVRVRSTSDKEEKLLRSQGFVSKEELTEEQKNSIHYADFPGLDSGTT